MVIDYRGLLSNNPQEQDDNMIAYYNGIQDGDIAGINESCGGHYFLKQGSKGMFVHVPSEYESYEVTEKAPGLKGIMGKTVTSNRFREKKKNVGVVADNLAYRYGICEFLPKESDGKRAQIIVDSKTGTAKIRRQPRNIEDVIKLITTDPRYVAQIDVSLIKSPADRQAVAEAVTLGVQNVLSYQSKLGVTYNDEEVKHRDEFAKEVTELYKTYEANWQKQQGNLKSLGEAMQ